MSVLRKKYITLLTQFRISAVKNDYVIFINNAFTSWKMLNVITLQINKLLRDSLKDEINQFVNLSSKYKMN